MAPTKIEPKVARPKPSPEKNPPSNGMSAVLTVPRIKETENLDSVRRFFREI